jgi:hypothetical protein
MKLKNIIRAAALSSAFLFAMASSSQAANLVYWVTLNVGTLVGNPNGLFSLDLQLAPGSNNVTNSVTLSNFSVTGGSLSGTASFSAGGFSGSSASSITLTNTSGSDNEYAETFSAGTTQILFKVTETLNSETVGSGTPVPEQFNVAVFDNGLNNLTTTDPSGFGALVTSVIASGQTLSSVQTFSSTSPSGVTSSVSSVPEPASAGLLLLGAAGLMARRKRTVA